jgi:aquaporin Z
MVKGESFMGDSLKKYLAEFVATFILVVVGCGTAVSSGGNIVATCLAFGISIVILAYTVGRISGGHANPAVSIAMAVAGKLSWKDFIFYIIAQFAGAMVGSLLLGLLFWGFESTGANGLTGVAYFMGSTDINFGTAMIGMVIEIVLTFLFVFAIFGFTCEEKLSNIAGLLIGIVLAGVHFLGFGLTGVSVNPARAFSALICSLFGGADAGNAFLTMFACVVGPFIGGVLAALCWKFFFGGKKAEVAE